MRERCGNLQEGVEGGVGRIKVNDRTKQKYPTKKKCEKQLPSDDTRDPLALVGARAWKMKEAEGNKANTTNTTNTRRTFVRYSVVVFRDASGCALKECE